MMKKKMSKVSKIMLILSWGLVATFFVYLTIKEDFVVAFFNELPFIILNILAHDQISE